jgi:hypothetical protein
MRQRRTYELDRPQGLLATDLRCLRKRARRVTRAKVAAAHVLCGLNIVGVEAERSNRSRVETAYTPLIVAAISLENPTQWDYALTACALNDTEPSSLTRGRERRYELTGS